jgi:glycosyltransferase involved in cell wall biosynthesis
VKLAGYAVVDRIVVPSVHVKESFRRDPTAYAKLFLNPYGVDLEMFPTTERHNSHKEFTLLFVGSWTLRKGCDLLISAIAQTPGVRLVHVGSTGSALSISIPCRRASSRDSMLTLTHLC